MRPEVAEECVDRLARGKRGRRAWRLLGVLDGKAESEFLRHARFKIRPHMKPLALLS